MDHTIISYIGFINSKGILERKEKKWKETIFDSILEQKGSIFFNLLCTLLASAAPYFPSKEEERQA